jgi:hypothetical protein
MHRGSQGEACAFDSCMDAAAKISAMMNDRLTNDTMILDSAIVFVRFFAPMIENKTYRELFPFRSLIKLLRQRRMKLRNLYKHG